MLEAENFEILSSFPLHLFYFLRMQHVHVCVCKWYKSHNLHACGGVKTTSDQPSSSILLEAGLLVTTGTLG